MAITVEDGSVVASANSFVTVAEVTARAALVGADDWAAGDPTDQEKAVVVAAYYLLTRYRTRWKGQITIVTQTLSWPRAGAWDELGADIANNVVPQCVKDAQCELAIQALRNKAGALGLITLEAQAPAETANARTIKSETVKAGPVTRSREYSSSATTQPSYVTAHRLLYPVLMPNDGQVVKL